MDNRWVVLARTERDDHVMERKTARRAFMIAHRERDKHTRSRAG
jgi:hypothetical protein